MPGPTGISALSSPRLKPGVSKAGLGYARREAPFVVVSRQDTAEAADDLGLRQGEGRRGGDVVEVVRGEPRKRSTIIPITTIIK